MMKQFYHLLIFIMLLCLSGKLSAQKPLSGDGLMTLPGKSLADKDLQAWLQHLGKRDAALSTATKYYYPAKGVQLEFHNGTLSRVELYNNSAATGAVRFTAFSEMMPGKVVFTDSRAVVVNKLGRPVRILEDRLEFNYLNQSVTVFFSRGIQKIIISIKSCVSGDCTDGYGVFVSRNGERYEGYWKQSQRYGKGTCYYVNGDKYEGNWRGDQPNGEGVMTYKNGTTRKGLWENGVFKGENYYKTNTLYELLGRHKDSEQVRYLAKNYGNGYQEITLPYDQSKYTFNNGKLILYFDEQGYIVRVGVYKTGIQDFSGGLAHSLSSGSDQKHVLYLLGEPKQKSNVPTGSMWVYFDGDYKLFIYFTARKMFQNIEVKLTDPALLVARSMEGTCLKGNCKEGYGEMNSEMGKYRGYFKNGMFNGQGTLQYRSGGIYKGTFKNNLRNGQGVYTWSDKTVYTGNWINNQQSGTGTMTYPNQDRYEGQWTDNRRSGKGTMIYANGDKYTGNWQNDQRNGQGTLLRTNGTRISGIWTGDALTQTLNTTDS